MQDLKKRQTEEESQREDLQNEIERILEESSEGMDALDDEDVVSSKSCFFTRND
jgi:nicotinamide riboside kinase